MKIKYTITVFDTINLNDYEGMPTSQIFEWLEENQDLCELVSMTDDLEVKVEEVK